METWHYVAIGAVVVGAVWYVKRRKKTAPKQSAKVQAGVAAYQRLKAAGVKTAADPIDYTEALAPSSQAPTGRIEIKGLY